MARVVWTEPAIADLEAIAEYTAVENPVAASDVRIGVKPDFRGCHIPEIGGTCVELQG